MSAELKAQTEHVVGYLASRAFAVDEIAGVLGLSMTKLLLLHADLICASQPPFAEYVRLRGRRLARTLDRAEKLVVYDAIAELTGRVKVYPLSLNNRVANAIRSTVRQSFRLQKLPYPSMKSSELEPALGYTIEDLMTHVESQFEDGMTWENWGRWHIDHIRPRCSFVYRALGDEEFKACWSLSNLQPLWAGENMRKSGRYPYQ